jgi:putative nucleotidyltransferase with HDIG domain
VRRGTRRIAVIIAGLRPAGTPETWLGLYVVVLAGCAIALIGLIGAAYALRSPLVTPGAFQWPALVLLAGVGLLADRYRITLASGAETSAGFLAFFLSAAIVGPLGAVVVAVICQVWALRSAGWLQAVCFTSAATIISGGSGLFYWTLVVHSSGSPVVVAAYGLAAGTLFHLLNYVVFMPVMWLRRGMGPKELWSMGFQPFLIFHFFFLVMALGLVSIYRAYVPESGVGPTLYSTLLVVLCLLPVVGLIYAFRAYANQRDLAIHNSRLAVRNERLALDAVASHVVALDLKDDYTAQHSAAVAQWATDIAKAMDLPDQQVYLIHLAGLLHDVGKIGVPDELLKSSSQLDSEDWALIESHCFHGHKILARVAQFQELADVVLHHHERYDGNGYPHGLSGIDIPIESRIIAVADAYSAMISQRPYGPPLPTIIAEAELEYRKGTQFDPTVVDHFMTVLRGRGEAYRLGMKADFRMEVQEVRFLRELPMEPEEVQPPPKRAVRVTQAKKQEKQQAKGEPARAARREAQERAGRRK